MELEILSHCALCGGRSLQPFDPECNIARCVDCGYIFDNPRPTLEELVKFYSRQAQYDSWLDELNARDRLWHRRLSLLCDTRKKGSLLDIGAGIGQFLSAARNYYDDVYGTEVSDSAIRIAKERYAVDLFEGTVESVASRGMVFDNVSLFHVLEHVPDPLSVLRTCHSLLSDHGILVIAVPNEVVSLRASLKRKLVNAGLRKPLRVGRSGLPKIELTPETSEVHLSHFTPPVLNQLLARAGFSVITQTLDPYYVATGTRRLKADLYYYSCLLFHKIVSINIYDAILVIARKNSVSAGQRRAA
jgi:SAM-dependent methyltransferase